MRYFNRCDAHSKINVRHCQTGDVSMQCTPANTNSVLLIINRLAFMLSLNFRSLKFNIPWIIHSAVECVIDEQCVVRTSTKLLMYYTFVRKCYQFKWILCAKCRKSSYHVWVFHQSVIQQYLSIAQHFVVVIWCIITRNRNLLKYFMTIFIVLIFTIECYSIIFHVIVYVSGHFTPKWTSQWHF